MLTKTNCEVCSKEALKVVVDLGNHALCDDLVPIGSDRVCEQFPILISFCPQCKTAHQTKQVPKQLLFPDSYHYRARHTLDVLEGMRQLVDTSATHYGGLSQALVLDIGCNDGSLLSIYKQRGAKTVGVEPTAAAVDALAEGHNVYRDYFSPTLADEIVTAHGYPDIITFTNVFAHIEDLPTLLEGVGRLMSSSTLLIVENHYFGSVLSKSQFDTFYHEHPRTYSLTSFKYIAQTLNAKMVDAEFPARYGGNVRVIMQRAADDGKVESSLSSVFEAENLFEQNLIELGRKIPQWVAFKRKALKELTDKYGPLPGKAFPGRAAILVKLLDIDENTLSAVYEKPGSMKIGHYLPGTRIPILSDSEFEHRPNKHAPIINLAWHISEEIHKYLRENGCDSKIIDIFSTQEFAEFS